MQLQKITRKYVFLKNSIIKTNKNCCQSVKLLQFFSSIFLRLKKEMVPTLPLVIKKNFVVPFVLWLPDLINQVDFDTNQLVI